MSEYKITPRGEIEVKGKDIMTTYWIEDLNHSNSGSEDLPKQPYVSTIDLRVLR